MIRNPAYFVKQENHLCLTEYADVSYKCGLTTYGNYLNIGKNLDVMRNRLGNKLRSLRQKRRDSLRGVEAKTGISNAYLSQLERGVATRPNPDILQRLAEHFGVPYFDLMRDAGYLPTPNTGHPSELITAYSEASATSSDLSYSLADLTKDEESMVLQYIEFLKSRRNIAGEA